MMDKFSEFKMKVPKPCDSAWLFAFFGDSLDDHHRDYTDHLLWVFERG